ncbi:hypothetical protein CALVIDRAFT_563466 [Calocera viscosa TUFC12733]|uniref:Lytic polysaccharide monooxygenase n=1 Tax=Calocera viscosa (strain TUFC12733) TaxID=1330018 RepID=A0A167MKM0_CALVF|nr:hypothetical protein CALVIDRAFT_563466 [Calocera viscosa TUFC12733]
MFALSLVVTCLACRVFAAPITPSRTVQKREPHPPVLTLPTPGTELYVMVNSDWNYAPQYFQFPLIMTDGEALFPYARAMFQNSSGTYQAGDNIPVYNSWTYEAIVKTTLSIIAPGDYCEHVAPK